MGLTNRELEEIGRRVTRLPAWEWARSCGRNPQVVSLNSPEATISVGSMDHSSDLEDFLMNAQGDVKRLLETVRELMVENQRLGHELATIQPGLPGM